MSSAATPQHDIEIRQGASYRLPFVYKHNDLPVDLSGYSAVLQVRDRPGGKVFASLSSGAGTIQITPLAGRVEVVFSHPLTRAIPSGEYEYDLLIVSADGMEAVYLAAGKFTIEQSVTRI